MSLATRNKIRRKFGGKFTEQGEFIEVPGVMPRRYRCSCNPNGFVAGQVINHYKFCPYHGSNIDLFLGQESTLVQVAVALCVIAMCFLASWAVILSIASL